MEPIPVIRNMDNGYNLECTESTFDWTPDLRAPCANSSAALPQQYYAPANDVQRALNKAFLE
jgi:hypothetical protein